MGILTNPNTDDTNRLVKFLQSKGGLLGLISYLAGIVWLGFLANAEYNLGKKIPCSFFVTSPVLIMENVKYYLLKALGIWFGAIIIQ